MSADILIWQSLWRGRNFASYAQWESVQRANHSKVRDCRTMPWALPPKALPRIWAEHLPALHPSHPAFAVAELWLSGEQLLLQGLWRMAEGTPHSIPHWDPPQPKHTDLGDILSLQHLICYGEDMKYSSVLVEEGLGLLQIFLTGSTLLASVSGALRKRAPLRWDLSFRISLSRSLCRIMHSINFWTPRVSAIKSALIGFFIAIAHLQDHASPQFNMSGIRHYLNLTVFGSDCISVVKVIH